jgi:hypothetical protein
MSKINRVGVDHPEVCGGNTGAGPCTYQREVGSLYCPLHGAANSKGTAEKAELRNLRINSIYAQRAKDLTQNSGIKCLGDEIALMRVTLETVFNSIKNENEMLMYADKIENLTKGVSNLVVAWQKLQERNKELLDRQTVMSIADGILEEIVRLVDNPDTIRQLADAIYNVVTKGLGGEASK